LELGRRTAASYPHDLRFDLPADDDPRAAIACAAAALDLPIALDGALMRVTVWSPQECYLFGRRTGALLDFLRDVQQALRDNGASEPE
jgi:hypothetical protein